ncbi:Glutamate--cysteine ligase [Sodalis glossinidius str. 'morsitans']|uniref:Glutamate--cysteine ligase n=2 Tax=Sodalis glossinidius (strain morsitans) TaxID=343509 RepID=GSH1_SODGM|nr:glutamate--cysteine ligase [Sodalis glossinidius]Q2NVK9.1 RecName: Full=Glutamate--cysteine ligase; AltName: Full=Gamma-ECS; Short=GCS; AltName: Full=Gamma-glutamylcysteine synthetase [Sodalis glossinidius str. 'morsitans']BAE73816.1 gamma-glutamylcysteine synthase [Sodalis glossinidius str. 'morsitans']CRL44261.1 Glutamate--cysteine ligase [Sodalis glossinidius str. 'morsitans']
MIPDVSTALSWLEANPQALKGIRRGVEREGLRINANGSLAQTPHPESLGSALTHKWITTDFAEALLEFITPVDDDIDHMLTLLRDIHRYVARRLGDERLWPMSMPCFIDSAQPIELAQYGSSNIGRMKTLYRKGLKNRYSALMQVIAGVHYNFSLPLAFWQAYAGIRDEASGKEAISAGYLRLIRNYYRFGWIILYLFGASPGICPSFLNGRKTDLLFEQAPSGLIYLPYATSLRLSDLGYTNKSQSQLNITFNHLDEYVRGLKQAIKTPSADYQRMGLQRGGHYLQLNTNVLQIENELYAPIRPKRVTRDDESPSDALMRGGIEYVEVRSLDINPFSPVGVDEEQARFLDLFLIWCTLAEAPEMSAEELRCTRTNWNRVILEGRKPGLMLGIDCGSTEQPLTILGKSLFSDLRRVAETLDSNNGDTHYQLVCDKLVAGFDNPELTLSARFMDQLIEHGIGGLGLILANDYRQTLRDEPLQVLNEAQLDEERLRSWQRQRSLEVADHLSFDEFLASQNGR